MPRALWIREQYPYKMVRPLTCHNGRKPETDVLTSELTALLATDECDLERTWTLEFAKLLKKMPVDDVGRPGKLLNLFSEWEKSVGERVATTREEMLHAVQKRIAFSGFGLPRSFGSQAIQTLLY